jgi:glycosyltransferase involved in cell wall biosynthesis
MTSSDRPIAFVSNMDGSPWGGSEELWAGAALKLAHDGLPVRASVHGWPSPHPRIANLATGGVDVQMRRWRRPLWFRIWRNAFAPERTADQIEIADFLAARRPALVVLCEPNSAPALGAMQECVSQGIPFVTIAQSNSEHFWLDDGAAEAYRKLIAGACRCYFVSQGNRKLLERQIGCKLPNAEIVFNPFNVDFDSAPPWPSLTNGDPLRMACVARLHPPSKGQDILLEALASDKWRDRNWSLAFYGDGPMRESIQRMIDDLVLSDRVKVAGFTNSIEQVWAEHHVLAMPSRYEGLPLAMVEAMLCARPVVATDVAGHSEVIEDGVNGIIADAPTAPSFARALERVWTQRPNLRSMGVLASQSIRRYVPSDPARFFAEKLKAIAAAS